MWWYKIGGLLKNSSSPEKDDVLHRTDGPAYFCTCGCDSLSFFLEGKELYGDSSKYEEELEKQGIYVKVNLDELTTTVFKDKERKIPLREVTFDGVVTEFPQLVEPVKKFYVNSLGKQTDVLHCVDGPAVVYPDGKEEWWLFGVELTPEEAIDFKNKTKNLVIEFPPNFPWVRFSGNRKNGGPNYASYGYRHWEQSPGVEHRLDGPARIWDNGLTPSFYIEGKNYSEEDWKKEVDKINAKPIESKPTTFELKDSKGRFHSLDGPAVKKEDGSEEYWIFGSQLSDEEIEIFKKPRKIFSPGSSWLVSEKDASGCHLNINKDGTQVEFCKNHAYFRKNGPAFISLNSKSNWHFKDGKKHNEKGPAILDRYYLEGENITREQWKKKLKVTKTSPSGKLHCLDGPAVTYPDGTEEYWIFGSRLSNEEIELFKAPRVDRLDNWDKAEHNDLGLYIRKDGLKVEFALKNGILSRKNGPVSLTDSGNFNLVDDVLRPEPMELKDNKGRLHCTTGPAVRKDDGTVEYWVWGEPLTLEEGRLLEVGGTLTLEVGRKGTISLRKSDTHIDFICDGGGYRRKDGPALINCEGKHDAFFKNAQLHNTEGPVLGTTYSLEDKILTKEVWEKERLKYTTFEKKDDKGRLHCLTGPAVRKEDGTEEWWIWGEQITDEEAKLLVLPTTDHGWFKASVVLDKCSVNLIGGEGLNVKEIEFCRSKNLFRKNGPSRIKYSGEHNIYYHDGNLSQIRYEGLKNSKPKQEESYYPGTKLLHTLTKPASDGNYYLMGSKLSEEEVISLKDGRLSYKVTDGKFIFETDGKQHRRTGPAVIHADGKEEYWFWGDQLTDTEVEAFKAGDLKFNSYCIADRFGNCHREGGRCSCFNTKGVGAYRYKGLLHRVDGSAYESNGAWYFFGQPIYAKTVEKLKSGELKATFKDDVVSITNKEGKLSCEDGPAVFILKDGIVTTEFWFNGIRYNNADSLKKKEVFYPHTKILHNYDGPACYNEKGEPEYWFFGNRITTEEWDKIQSDEINLIKQDTSCCFLVKINDKWVNHRGDNKPTMLGLKYNNWWYNGELHRVDGPAYQGTGYYLYDTYYTKEAFDKAMAEYNDPVNATPTKVLPDGTKQWLYENKLHREEGPAEIKPNGEVKYSFFGYPVTAQEWQDNKDGKIKIDWEKFSSKTDRAVQFYKDGVCHRKNGPSYIQSYRRWYEVEGKRHRVDGPAFDSTHLKEYWLNDVKFSSEEKWAKALSDISVTPITPVIPEVVEPEVEPTVALEPSKPIITESHRKLFRRALISQTEPIFTKMVGKDNKIAKNLLQYFMGYAAAEHYPTASKELRVQALEGLGTNFLDEIAQNLKKSIQIDAIDQVLNHPQVVAAELEQAIILEEILENKRD